jgi:signal transduction histidine kinase
MALAHPIGRLGSSATWLARRLDRLVLVRASLWWLAVAASAATLRLLVMPVAVLEPAYAGAMSIVAGVVGVALLQLGLLRFYALGRPLDLLVGVGFGTTAVGNLLSAALEPGTVVGVPRLETAIVLVLATRALAYMIFGLAVYWSTTVVPTAGRRRTAGFVASGALLSLVAVTGVVLWVGQSLPAALTPHVGASLPTGAPADDLLDAEASWLLVPNLALTVLLVVVTHRLTLLARELGDAWLGALGWGFGLLGLSQVLGLLFPSGVPGYVSISDVFRLLAYLALLFCLINRVTEDLAERASIDERLRLSRELHDGLAQQLSLLNLRLSEALRVCAQPATGPLGRNLHTSQRLAQSALLEARQAITSLRTGSISWDEFVESLDAFCDETSRNQAVDVRLSMRGVLPAIDAELQVEVMRMFNETISNAVRHGEATRIDVEVDVQSQHRQLLLSLRDNGRGFAPDGRLVDNGVGLRSLAERLERRSGALRLESGASGTVIQAELPLKWRGRPE